EMTCAYYDQLHYYPRTNEDLRKHDPVTYKLLESVWGKPKPGTTPKVSRGSADPSLLLSEVKLGKSVAGPKVSADDLKDRPVLVIFGNATTASSLTFLSRATAWDNELGAFGLATVGAHLTGNKEADVAAVVKSHALTFAVTDAPWVKGGYVTESKEFPLA